MDADILGRRKKLQQQQIKELRALHNFKEVDDSMNFPKAVGDQKELKVLGNYEYD